MLPITLRLDPSDDLTHTRLGLTIELEQPLQGWQLKDLASMLESYSRRRTRVVLSAAVPVEWLDDWCPALEDAALEIHFRVPRRRTLRG